MEIWRGIIVLIIYDIYMETIMIDQDKIMPFNFFKYGGVYSGEHHGMRYVIKRTGDKPDFILIAVVWPGPYCYDATSDELKTQAEFTYDEIGRKEAIDWLLTQYDSRKEEWEHVPSILEASIDVNHIYAKAEKKEE
jgi:hypothetical protein